MQREKGKGIVKVIPSMAKACKYCTAVTYCGQAAELLKAGKLDLS